MGGREGRKMTVTDVELRPAGRAVGHRPARSPNGRRRPAPTRPAGGAVAFRGTGVATSRAPHRRRPVSAAVTIALAGMAALITVWLGALAHSGGVGGSAPAVPDKLAVVQVQAGDNLERLAARVAPDAPVGQVVERIKELNRLDSAALDAGQTLIAPVG
ncbi:MAG TPA: LysM peptidoglycan-binding domain-containing protein [Mycobacterium sp.]|nr:LysM peptidoglycan-binding domain-containing protein [Mycobacterium sp.]HME48018.1 LysM peptidoglycan-binding domain-containing protein [Mycobacterium sp.]